MDQNVGVSILWGGEEVGGRVLVLVMDGCGGGPRGWPCDNELRVSEGGEFY